MDLHSKTSCTLRYCLADAPHSENSEILAAASITAQSDALRSSGLEDHGFVYINIDSGWMGSFDGSGRPIPNTSTFPNIQAFVAHIHANGQKAGIYWIPGVEYPAVAANYPILVTPYHIQPGPGASPQLSERSAGESGRYPIVRTPVPAEPAKA